MLLTSTSRKSVRHPRALLFLAIAFLVFAIAWPTFAAATDVPLSADARDAVHGFLYGLAFGLFALMLCIKAMGRWQAK